MAYHQKMIEDIRNDMIKSKREPIKIIEVRTLNRGRSKSIVVPGVLEKSNNSNRISRLNNYTANMKKHRGSISISSKLDSIEEEDGDSMKLQCSEKDAGV